jgi:5'-3' exonuclease
MQKKVYEFLSDSMQDLIIEWKTCEVSGEEFAIYQGDRDLLKLLSPTISGVRYDLPLPSVSRQERQKRLMVRRNERALYKRVSDLSGDSLLSVYKPECPYKIYSVKERWSDERDAADYAREIDRSRSIFEQLQELREQVPHMALINDDVSKNSLFCNQTAHMKDCYLTFNSDNLEQCHYSRCAKHSNYCMD